MVLICLYNSTFVQWYCGIVRQPGEGSSRLGKIHVDAVLSTAQRSLPTLHHTASSQMSSWKLTLMQGQKEQALDGCSRAAQPWRASASLLNSDQCSGQTYWKIMWGFPENKTKQNKENTKQPNKTVHQYISSMQILKPDFKGGFWKGWPAICKASAPASPLTLIPPDVASHPTHTWHQVLSTSMLWAPANDPASSPTAGVQAQCC